MIRIYRFLVLVTIIIGSLYAINSTHSSERLSARQFGEPDNDDWIDFSNDIHNFIKNKLEDTHFCNLDYLTKLVELHPQKNQIKKSLRSQRMWAIYFSDFFLLKSINSCFFDLSISLEFQFTYDKYLAQFWRNWICNTIDINNEVLTTPYMLFACHELISLKGGNVTAIRIVDSFQLCYANYNIALLIILYESKIGLPSGTKTSNLMLKHFGYPLLTEEIFQSNDSIIVNNLFSREILRNLSSWVSINDLLKLRFINKTTYKTLMFDSLIWRMKINQLLKRNVSNSKIIKDVHLLGIAVRLTRQPIQVFYLDLLLKVLTIPEIDRIPKREAHKAALLKRAQEAELIKNQSKCTIF